MTPRLWAVIAVYFALLAAVAVPLGRYIARVFAGESTSARASSAPSSAPSTAPPASTPPVSTTGSSTPSRSSGSRPSRSSSPTP